MDEEQEDEERPGVGLEEGKRRDILTTSYKS